MSAPTPSAGPVPTWRVTSQIEAQDRDLTGAFVQGFRVYFETGNGQTGSVFLSHVNYSADNVRRAIAAKAALMDAVSNLTS